MSVRDLGRVVACAALLLAQGVAQGESTADADTSSRVRLAEPPVLLPDFSLLGRDGEPTRFADTGSGARLVYFGFAHCPDVCPAAMQKLREVQRALSGEDEAVTCVLISVDGDRDTPQAMQAFLASFGTGFVGLTGKPAEVRKIANSFAAVFFKGMPTDRKGGYNVEHTSQIYLVDGEGRLRATFYDAPAERIIAATRRVAREPASSENTAAKISGDADR